MKMRTKVIRDVLIEARDTIARPEAWTRTAMARNASGKEIDVCADEAVCFCADGAVKRAASWFADPDERQAVECICFARLTSAAGVAISIFNDNRTHGEVIAAFDKAIDGLDLFSPPAAGKDRT